MLTLGIYRAVSDILNHISLYIFFLSTYWEKSIETRVYRMYSPRELDMLLKPSYAS